ncbi:MAG: hypothetical protein GEU78_01755 [Actinobacteria bacterium]|nr:hypothetical protein [Actinomycetota bacterium]
MLDAPPTMAMAGLGSVLVSALMVVLAYLTVKVVLPRREVDVIVALGLILPALLTLTLVLMLVHIATDGWLFSSPGAVRVITVVMLPGLVALSLARALTKRRRVRDEPAGSTDPDVAISSTEAAAPIGPPAPVPESFDPRALLGLLGVLIAAWVIWGRVVFEILPAGTGGDTSLHMGWSGQLLNGERLPSNALAGPIENYYPWLYHSGVAWLSALTPGGRPFHVLGPLQLLQVTGAVTALYALGYTLWRRWYAGASVAVLGAITGGFGWLAEAEPEIVKNVRGPDAEVGKFFGDFLGKRPYNGAMHNLAPVYPRDVAYALLPALLLLFALSLKTRRLSYLIAAGVVVGLIGLTGGEAFVAAAAVTLVFVVTAGDVGRLRAAMSMGIPAIAIYALWFAPLMINYAKHEGFFDLSSRPVVLTPLQVLGAWGIVTPLAVLGIVLLAFRLRRNDGSRVALIYLITLAILTALVIYLSARLSGGFETLGRPHRYFPMFFQAAAICGGIGIAWVFERLARFTMIPAILIAAMLAYAAFASPWQISRILPDDLFLDPLLVSALHGEEDPWMAALSPNTGERCVVAVPGWITGKAFAYSGYRLVWYVWTKPRRNSARVRWRNIYSLIVPDLDRRADVARLTEGIGPPRLFRDAIERYGVDRIVVPKRFASSPVYKGYPRIWARSPRGGEMAIVEVDGCGDRESESFGEAAAS